MAQKQYKDMVINGSAGFEIGTDEEFVEFKNLIFQFGISSWGGTRKLPRPVLAVFIK